MDSNGTNFCIFIAVIYIPAVFTYMPAMLQDFM